MALIAMTREMGSLGKDVADELARRLSIPVVYHEVIEHLADRMRVRKSHVIRLLDGKAGILERMTADKTSMAIYTADEIFGLALKGKGAIIRGWGATNLLSSVPHAVCVRVCAPRDVRKQRMLERLGTEDSAFVDEEIRLSDEAQGAIMKRHFNIDWTDGAHYDVVLNTARISVEHCAEEIEKLVRSAEFQETEASRSRLADRALEAKVRAALRKGNATGGLPVAVSAQDGKVTLQGVVEKAEDRAAAAQLARAVEGVREVSDQLRASEEIRARYS